MGETIKVRVVKYPGRKNKNLMMRYVDPVAGRQVGRSSKTSKQRDAERAAAKWDAELRAGRYNKPASVNSDEFCGNNSSGA